MSLNQGGIVTTGKESSVVLKFSNGTAEDDTFILEAPTASMGVRGTNFFVGVDPNTGLPSLAVLSGNVNVTGSGNNSDQFNIYPVSALTVGGQDQLQMLPIDNQIFSANVKIYEC